MTKCSCPSSLWFNKNLWCLRLFSSLCFIGRSLLGLPFRPINFLPVTLKLHQMSVLLMHSELISLAMRFARFNLTSRWTENVLGFCLRTKKTNVRGNLGKSLEFSLLIQNIMPDAFEENKFDKLTKLIKSKASKELIKSIDKKISLIFHVLGQKSEGKIEESCGKIWLRSRKRQARFCYEHFMKMLITKDILRFSTFFLSLFCAFFSNLFYKNLLTNYSDVLTSLFPYN